MTMDERELKSALEAIIFASGEPVPAARISLVLGVPEEDVFSCAAGLAEEYEHEGRGIRLVRLDKSLQMCSAPQYEDEEDYHPVALIVHELGVRPVRDAGEEHL